MRTNCNTCGSLLPPPPTSPRRRTVAPEAQRGSAREDDSGIVDLRALRAAHEASNGPVPTGGRDRAAVLGRTPDGLGSSTLAPVVLQPGRSQGIDRSLVAAVVGGSALVASALVVAAAALGGPVSPPPPPLVGAAPTVPQERTLAEWAETRGDASAVAGDTPPEPSEPSADGTAETERTPAEEETTKPPRPRTSARPRRAAAPPPRTAEPADAHAPRTSGNRLIDLVDKALQNPDGTAPALPAYPETPDRNAVARAFRSVDARIGACVDDGTRGVLWVRATIVGDTGRVRRATVKGDYAGTAAGACAVRVVREVSFPRFTRAALDVEFPFSIR